MATLRIDIDSDNRARRELLNLRQQMQDINVKLTENAAAYKNADDAEKAKLRTDKEELELGKRRLKDAAAQIQITRADGKETERVAQVKAKAAQAEVRETERVAQVKAKAAQAEAKENDRVAQVKRKSALDDARLARQNQVIAHADAREMTRLTRETERAAKAAEQLTRSKQKLTGAAKFLSTSLGQIRFHLTQMVTSSVLYGVADFTRSIINIGAETETARATLRQFTTDVEGTFQRLARESQTLIGIDLTDILFSFTQLRGAGAGTEDSITLIRGFTKSLAELGVGAEETARFMTQLRQSFAANFIEGDDVKTLIEVMPTFLDRASRSLGVQVESWKNLQDAIDASGQTVREFYINLARQQDIESAGADVDTFRAQTELLREEWQGFQRGIAQRVIPTLTQIIKNLRSMGSAAGGAKRELSELGRELGQYELFGEREQPASVSVTNRLSADVAELRRIRNEQDRIAERLNVPFERARESVQNVIEGLKNDLRQIDIEREGTGFFGGLSLSASQNIITDSLKEQQQLLSDIIRLERERQEAAARVAATQRELTPVVPVPRPTATGDFGLTQPFGTFSPQTPLGPLGLSQPDQQFGGFGRRGAFLRPLREIGPQISRSDIQEIQTSVSETAIDLLKNAVREVTPSRLDTSGFTPSTRRLDIRPVIGSPIAPPVADLSGGLDLSQILPSLATGRTPIQDDIDTFIRGQRLPAQPTDIAAFIPVDQFEKGLADINVNFEKEKRLQREILQGREAFARDAEREIASRERLTRDLLQTGSESVLRIANIPRDLFGISRRGADQRRATATRSTEELESLERSTQRRIEEIQNNRVISERERADRILRINQELAERKADIEINYAAQIAAIEEQTAEQRSNYYFQFAQSAINDINRVIQREIVLRLIRDLSAALPGGIGTGLLAVASLGLTAASAGLSGAQAGRSESLARQQQSRFESASGRPIVIQQNVRYDDGTVRKQYDDTARIINEGITAR